MSSLNDLLGTRYPLIQAPMAGVQDSRLAIAVSQAGGLGSLPCGALPAEKIREQVAAIREVTDRPFNVNFFCHQVIRPEPGVMEKWQEKFAPWQEEFGLDPADSTATLNRQPFNQDMADLVSELKPPVVSFHYGLPAADLLEQVRTSGALVLSSATTVDEARWLEAHGADAIIAQGSEAGGHRGMFLDMDLSTQIDSATLLAQSVAAVSIPVIAAGGIASADDVRAALEAGASAVQVGTAFLLCPEANTSAVHRAALKSGAAQHTVITNIFSGRPARGIVNRMIRELGAINADAPPFPLAGTASATLKAYAEAQGSGDFSAMWAGQKVSGCREVPAAQQVEALMGALD